MADDLVERQDALTYDWNGHKNMPVLYPDKSNFEIAGMVRMLMRHDLRHEVVVTAARDRIMALDKQNAAKDDRITALEAEVERLNGLVYAPGIWRCAKCDFTLVQSVLNVATGTVHAQDKPGDPCPNCESPLWRVTEREQRKEAQAAYERLFDEKEAALASKDAEIERLNAIIRRYCDRTGMANAPAEIQQEIDDIFARAALQEGDGS